MTDLEAATTNREVTLIIDKSGSMEMSDGRTGRSRWESAQETTIALAHKLSKIDPDGITVYTFAGTFKRYDNVGPETVEKIFAENEPGGSTDLAGVLTHAFADWKARKDKGLLKNGDNIFVITDGQPDNPAAVKQAIKDIAEHVTDRKELAVTILQSGNDPKASEFLRQLDDDLQKEGAKHDIVDVKTFEQLENTTIKEVLLAAVTD